MASNLAKSENERRFIMGSVSHDIRTPLTRMKLSLEMLPKKSAFLKESMDHDIDEINQIVNQFLDFVRGFDDEPISSLNFGNFLTELKKQRYLRSRFKNFKNYSIERYTEKPIY